MSIRPPELDPKFTPPSTELLLSTPPDKRGFLLTQLSFFDDLHGTHHVEDFRRARDRCAYKDPDTGRQCTDAKYAKKGGMHCLQHSDLAELDPGWVIEHRSRAAKLRLADMLEKGVDRLEQLLDDDELAPAMKLAALQTLFDRSGLPKQSATTLDAHIEVADTTSATDIIRARLDRLSEAHVQHELDAIEAASEIIESSAEEVPDDRSDND